MYDLKKIIESHTKEDVVDYEAVMQSVDQEYVNPIVAKKTDSEKLQTEAVGLIVKDLGIDGNTIDDVKLWAKKMGGNTDEVKEANLTLTKERDKLQKEFDDVNKKYGNIQTEIKTTNEMSLITKAGFGEEELDFVHFKVSKNVNDDLTFNKALEEYAKEMQKDNKTDNKFVKKGFKSTGSEYLDAFNNRKKY